MNNMGKRLYVSPKSTAIEMEPLSMLSASLRFSDETTDISGRAREYDDFEADVPFAWRWKFLVDAGGGCIAFCGGFVLQCMGGTP